MSSIIEGTRWISRDGTMWLNCGFAAYAMPTRERLCIYEVLHAGKRTGRRVGESGVFGDRFVRMDWTPVRRLHHA